MDIFKKIVTGSIIGKYITGNETPGENARLKEWLEEDPQNKSLFEGLQDDKNIAAAINEFDSYDKDHEWKRHVERLKILLLQKTLTRWKVAAVVFIIAGIAGVIPYLNVEQDVSPVFHDELYTTVSTTRGQQSKIILPDSSVVWLNSETTISYNSNFMVGNRDIKLRGQAYFEITPNAEIPLFVECGEIMVKVLGTSFDVSAYPEDQSSEVALKSGSVELLHEVDGSVSYVLNPGEKAKFDARNREILISNVDINKHTAWKDGMLVFDDAPMCEVLEKLERWYNIEIEVKDTAIYSLVLNATFIKEDVADLCELLEYTCSVGYKINPSKDPGVPVKVILAN